MPWFLVSLWENSSPESYIYKVLQSSSLSLLLASYMFNSSCLSPWVSAFTLLSKCPSVALNISDSEQSSVPLCWDSHARQLHKGNTTGSTRPPPFPLVWILCTLQHTFAAILHCRIMSELPSMAFAGTLPLPLPSWLSLLLGLRDFLKKEVLLVQLRRTQSPVEPLQGFNGGLNPAGGRANA